MAAERSSSHHKTSKKPISEALLEYLVRGVTENSYPVTTIEVGSRMGRNREHLAYSGGLSKVGNKL